MSSTELSSIQEELNHLREELELTKKRLEEKEQLIESVFNATGAGYWHWNLTTKECYFSANYKKMLGYGEDEHPNTEEFYYSTLLEGEKSKVTEALNRVMRSNGERIYSHDATYRCKDGSTINLYCKGKAVAFDKNGKPTEIIGTSYDVSKLKQVHTALKDSETRLKLFSKGIGAGIYDWNIDTGEVWWSKGYFELLGLKNNEINPTYENFINLVHPEDRELIGRALKNHFDKNRPYRIENRQQNKNGKYLWVESTGQVLRDAEGKPRRMAGAVVDISERKKLEQELLTNQELLTQTSEIAMVGGWELDIANNTMLWSDVVYEIYELDHEDNVNLETSLKNYASEAYPTIKSAFENAIKNGDEFDLELPFITASERHIWVRVIGRPIKEEKKIVKLSGVIQDITEKKLAEIQMEALTETLVYQNKQLEDYAHITSHNLRAPIANLNALVSLHTKETEQGKKDLLVEKFAESSKKLMKTVDELTEVLMIKTSELRKIEELDLQETVDELVDSLNAEIMQKDAIITTNFSAVPKLEYFKPYLDSILLNLISNALKYSSPDRQPKIHLESSSNIDETILTVEDNGLGINLKRHGDKLFKLHKTFHRQADSRGLGLYIVKNQVEVMGGSIDCESEENKGTKFIITFSKNLPEHIR